MPFHDNFIFWLYLAAWIPYAAFVILYAARSPWYASPVGRALMLSQSVIVALTVHAMLIVTLGRDYPGHWAVRLVLVGGVIVSGWYQLANLVRLQRKNRESSPDMPIMKENRVQD